MKILFTADIHIKLNQKNVPINWAVNRYKSLFKQIVENCKDVDLLVIGGDIFDKLPSMDELELFFEFVSIIPVDCIIYSGNHEALKKNTTFLTYLKKVTASLNPNVEIIDDYHNLPGIDFIPYNKLKEWEKDPDNIFVGLGKVLCTHVRGEILPHVQAEIDLDLFSKWKVVLAGDLHSYSNCQRNILYPGSPLTVSFHRSPVDTGIILLDTDTLAHRFIKLDLPQLIRKTIKAGEPMPPGDVDHVIYEVEGDISELANITNSDLLDKVILSRNSDDVGLILDKNMSMVEEVEEYLRYVLNINEDSVKKILQEVNGYVVRE